MGNIIEKIVKDVTIIVVVILLIAITAGFDASAAAKITRADSNWNDDDNLSSAHSKLSWAASVGWITIAILIIVIILVIVAVAVTGGLDVELVPLILLPTEAILIIVLILLGVLSAWGAIDITKANLSDDQGAFSAALIATFASAGAVIGVILYIIGKFIYSRHEKNKAKEEAAAAKQSNIDNEKEILAGLVKAKS